MQKKIDTAVLMAHYGTYFKENYSMKKAAAFLVVMVGASLSLEAQKAGDKLLFPGFGFGASISSFEYHSGDEVGNTLLTPPGTNLLNDAQEDTSKGAYNIGIMYDYFFFDKLAINFGVNYDNNPLSYKYPKRMALYDLKFDYKFAFLSISCGFHYYFFEKLMIGSGLYVGIPILDDIKMTYGSQEFTSEMAVNNDVGIFFDLGYKFTITAADSILLSMRYKHGLTTVYDTDDAVTNIKIYSLYLVQLAYGIKL